MAGEEQKRVTLRRWTGDGMPPGPWQTDASIFAVESDTSEVEVCEFVPAADFNQVEAQRDQWKRAANGDRDGVVTHEYHLRVLRAVVTERVEARSSLAQALDALKRIATAHAPAEHLQDVARQAIAEIEAGEEKR